MTKNRVKAFIVGAGNMGCAMAKYDNFNNCGLNIIALFDNDKSKIGKPINNILVLDVSRLANLAKKFSVDAAILTVPEECAQDITNIMIKAGIKHIWNFTPVKLIVPEDVRVINENFVDRFLSFAKEI